MVAPNREDAREERRFRARALGRPEGPPRRGRVRRAFLGRGRRGGWRCGRRERGHRQILQEPPNRQEPVARDGCVQRQSHVASEADTRRPRRPGDLLVPQRASHGGERPGRLAPRRGRAARAAGGRVPRRCRRRLVPARRRRGAHRAHAQKERFVRREQGGGRATKKKRASAPGSNVRHRARGVHRRRARGGLLHEQGGRAHGARAARRARRRVQRAQRRRAPRVPRARRVPPRARRARATRANVPERPVPERKPGIRRRALGESGRVHPHRRVRRRRRRRRRLSARRRGGFFAVHAETGDVPDRHLRGTRRGRVERRFVFKKNRTESEKV